MRARCPETLQLAYTSIPPYIYKTEDSKIAGVFGTFLEDAINSWCAGQTNFSYLEVKSGLSGLEEHIVNDTVDVIFPIPFASKKRFYLGRPYVPVVESPGIAFFTSLEPDARDAIVNALSNGWPALIFVIMSALIAGMVFWFSELAKQSRQSKETATLRQGIIWEGPFKGFYWAMVSMTTVGYGDFYPKSAFGRLLATIWILMGIVIISLFTASVTTILLAACLSNDVTINRAQVAVMERSIEYSFAIKRNAIPSEHPNIDSLLEQAGSADYRGALLDSFVAGFYQERFHKFRLVEIMEYVFSYGTVLTNKGMWIEPNIRTYIENNKDKLFKAMSSSIIPLKAHNHGSAAEEKSASLLDIKNRSVMAMLVVTTSLIAILSLLGFIWDRCYLRRRFQQSEKGKPKRYSRQAFEMQQSQLRDRVEILGDIKRDMDNFLDLVRVQIALSNQKTNRTFEDDDLAISNIELLSG